MTYDVKGEEQGKLRDVVGELVSARLTGTASDAVANLDVDLDSAQRLQLDALQTLIGRGEAISGWKLGLTAGAARQLMGGFRPFGYLLARRTFESGVSIRLDQIARALIEPELCLVLGSDLKGHVSIDQAVAAVRGVAPAFELNELRLPTGATHAAIVADGVANWGIVVGAESPPRRELRFTHAHVYSGGNKVAEAEPGDALDDPYESLATLARKLDRFGLGLSAGQFVLTGAFSFHSVDAPGSWRADFDSVGTVGVRFL